MKRSNRTEWKASKGLGHTTMLLSLFFIITMLLAACGSEPSSPPVVDVASDNQAEVEMTPAAVDEESDVVTETLDIAESEATTAGETEVDDVTVITDTELITGTEVVTDIIVTTNTAVIEQQEITTVITTTDVVTDVDETTDTTTETESNIITDTAQLTPQAASAEARADVNVTPLAPTPTPTVVVQLTRVVTDTEVVTDTVEVTAVATPRPGQTPRAQSTPAAARDTETAVAFIGVERAAGRTIQASTLIDADFVTADGDVSGEIQDIVVNMQNGQVLYVLLEYGGLFDIGDTDMPVPLSAFSWNTRDELVLNVDGQRLENFPGVSNDWPVPEQDDWDLDVRNFWENTDFDLDFDAAQAASGVRRVSDLLDDPISDASFGEGSVEDMLIALSEGRVSFVLISFSGVGLAEDWYVIPFTAFDPTAPQDGLYLNADFDPSLLEQAPRFDTGVMDQSGVFADGFDNEWREFWHDAGYPFGIGDGE